MNLRTIPIRKKLAGMQQRNLTPIDHLVGVLDRALHSVAGGQHAVTRPSPAAAARGAEPPEEEARRESGRLMRVNHAGEVAAQALYHGQAAVARDAGLREHLQHAADEEADHLAWCEQRLNQLDTPLSRLTPLWYGGAFAIGATAGLAGDRISLGFLSETERQVEEHLEGHLRRLPPGDVQSRLVLEQMKQDERQHGQAARDRGGVELPGPVRALMRLSSKVMTTTAYWV